MIWKIYKFISDIKFKLIILSLLIIAMISLLIYSGKESQQNLNATTEEIVTKQYTAEELKTKIPNEIDTILFTFGIWKELIKDEGIKGKNENLWFNKEILIPYDLPLSSVNYELKSFFKSVNFSSTVKEDPRTKNLLIESFYADDSTKKVLGIINLKYSDKVIRNASDISIILKNVDKLEKKEFENIITSPEKFSVILPITFETAEIQSGVMEAGRDYVLLYELGNIDTPEKEFRNDMPEKQWKGKIRSLTNEYQDASGIFIKNPIKDYAFETDLINQFSKYTKNVFKDSELIEFTTTEKKEKKIYDLFSQILTNTNKGMKTQIYLVEFNEEDFRNYIKEINNLRKRGFRFMTFKEIMKVKEPKK